MLALNFIPLQSNLKEPKKPSNVTKNSTSRNLTYSILLNLVISLLQVIGGIVSGSYALISDALHNFSDVLSLSFSLYAHKLSLKKASLHQTFGLKRAELIAAFINAIVLIVVAGFLIVGAISKLLHPEPIISNLVIILALLGIVVNGFSALLLKAQSTSNINIKSAYFHLFTDMLASIGVLLGGVLMYFFNCFWVDSLMTLLIAFYLIYVGVSLLKDATKMLMLFTPDSINIEEIVQEVHAIEGVNLLHHIHVWQLNDNELHLEAHLDCSQNIRLSEFNDLLHKIEQLLLEKFQINHTNIQPEFNKEDSKELIVQD